MSTTTKKQILNLTLTWNWFEKIHSGEKPEEYREIKKYWITRLDCGRHYDAVKFVNGYGAHRPWMILDIESISRGQGNPEHGAPVGKDVFIIGLGELIEDGNIPDHLNQNKE